jgi:putative DNA primase/helicase
MTHDHTIKIATAHTAHAKHWTNKSSLWSELVTRLQTPVRTKETLKEFLRMNKAEQGHIKDVGGFVGGELRGGRRSPQNVLGRTLITLDLDFATPSFWDDFTLLYENAAFLHGTHKHQSDQPRLRLIMPLDREVDTDEYQAIARQVAGVCGIELFDNTTFEVNRLMYWPSVPVDVEYYHEVQEGPFLCADEVLASYRDWRDTSLWPTSGKKLRELGDAAAKMQDPDEKSGIVGFFCRTYTISQAIDAFLSDKYSEGTEGRYTYAHGSTSSGLVVYDDKFAFSHHGTDPCSGKLVNAFDLVRIHLFGHLDSEDYAGPINKARSFIAMEDFARSDNNVKGTIAQERMDAIQYEFEGETLEAEVEHDVAWMKELEADKRGAYLSSSTNINIILRKDPRLKNAFQLNEFNQKQYVCRSLPWRKITFPEPVKDVDFAGVRNYIETMYGITGAAKVKDSLTLEFERNTFHPIKDYLGGLAWDGQPRIDALLPEYFGAEDNQYTREAMRKMLVGAVSRIYRPGCKFDLVMTLVGKEGLYKSMFIDRLSNGWFSDTFLTVHGKEALEQIQGVWLVEIAELSAFRKSDAESIKHFISKREDTFRGAYKETTQTHLRQCVFFGTTNLSEFLKDPTGNRRFMPIQTRPEYVKRSLPNDFTPEEVGQVWAEALTLYHAGERLYLSAEASDIAKRAVLRHSETDERQGIIESFLDMRLPVGWESMGIYQRQAFFNDQDKGDTYEGAERTTVCIAEIWCECLGRDRKDMTRYATREINDIMRAIPGWEQPPSPRDFPVYGKQKYYKRQT